MCSLNGIIILCGEWSPPDSATWVHSDRQTPLTCLKGTPVVPERDGYPARSHPRQTGIHSSDTHSPTPTADRKSIHKRRLYVKTTCKSSRRSLSAASAGNPDAARCLHPPQRPGRKLSRSTGSIFSWTCQRGGCRRREIRRTNICRKICRQRRHHPSAKQSGALNQARAHLIKRFPPRSQREHPNFGDLNPAGWRKRASRNHPPR